MKKIFKIKLFKNTAYREKTCRELPDSTTDGSNTEKKKKKAK